jgi:hypothetical protein
MPGSLEALLIVAFGLVPGYLFLVARRTFAVGDTRDKEALLLECIAGSLVFWVVVGTPFLLASGWRPASLSGAAQSLGPRWLMALAAVAVVLPLLAGFGVGRVESRRGWLLGRRRVHPKAWDWRFSRPERLFVLVTLTDGTQLGGYWGSRSFASSFPNEEDLFLEAVYDVEDGRIVQEKVRTRGAWVPKGSIRALEFWSAEDEGSNDGREENRRLPAACQGENREGTPAARAGTGETGSAA